jgi:flavin-dependent dehydrogenase
MRSSPSDCVAPPLPTFFRVPSGPGWALVGDAGQHKDPMIARGIADAFRDGDLVASAVVDGWDGDLDGALADTAVSATSAPSR